jgi:hypothetical protein
MIQGLIHVIDKKIESLIIQGLSRGGYPFGPHARLRFHGHCTGATCNKALIADPTIYLMPERLITMTKVKSRMASALFVLGVLALSMAVTPQVRAQTAAVDGVDYYYCGGNFYKAAFQGNNLVYVTAKP